MIPIEQRTILNFFHKIFFPHQSDRSNIFQHPKLFAIYKNVPDSPTLNFIYMHIIQKNEHIQPQNFTTNNQTPSGFSIGLQPWDLKLMSQSEISPGDPCPLPANGVLKTAFFGKFPLFYSNIGSIIHLQIE